MFLTCVLCFSGNAQVVHWEFAGWDGGGCFPNIEIDPNIKGRVYLTSDVAGLWRSDDLGENWRFATAGLQNLNVAALAIAPSDSNVLYAATAGGLYVSRDGATSWSATKNPDQKIKFQRPQSYRPVAVSSTNSQKVCVAPSTGTVFCSDDAGQRWQTLSGGQQETLTVIYFDSSSKLLFVGGLSGFQIYDFATKAWSNINTQLRKLTDLVISSQDSRHLFAAADGKMWFSSDEGQTWQQAAGNTAGDIFRLLIVDSEPTDILAAVNQGWSGKVLLSKDYGTTWENVVEHVAADRRANPTRLWASLSGKITSLKSHPKDSNIVFRSDWWGVFRSDDGAKTWNEKISGAPNTVASDIAITSDSLLVATMDNGLLKSFDQGQTYHSLFPLDKYESVKAGHVWRVIVPRENKIVATSSPWNEKNNQVIVSDDGGLNFKIVRKGLPAKRPSQNTMWGQGYPRALTVDPQNSDKLYLGIDGDDGGGLFISDDGGLSWARSAGQPDSLRIYNALAVDPTDSQRIFWGACGKGGGVYRSKDGGKTWQRVLSQMSWVFDIVISAHGTIYAAGDYAGAATVFVSHDHGVTWKKLNNPRVKGVAEALAIDPTNEQRIAFSVVQWSAGAPGKIMMSLDGGTHWDDVTFDLPDGAGAAAMAFSSNGEYLYAARYAGSVYRLKVQ